MSRLIGCARCLTSRARVTTPSACGAARLMLNGFDCEVASVSCSRKSRSSAGSRSILSLMREDGEQLGRFKVRSLMRELDLVSKQPGSHAYKRATVERLDIPNTLNREFDVPAPNQVWCAAISPTFGRKESGITWLSSWIIWYASDLGLGATSEKPDAELVIKALDMAYEQRGRPSDPAIPLDQGSQYAADSFASGCGDTACARA